MLRGVRDGGGNVFNPAYVIRGDARHEDKIGSVVDYYVAPLVKLAGQIDGSSMEEAWKTILPSFGMGSFMAGQIVADLRWAVSGTWEDRNQWAPAGPGSTRGMNRLLGRPVNCADGSIGVRAQLSLLVETCSARLPASITGRLEAIDWQNCCCEWDKHERARLGEGRPRQRFAGTGA